jgi:hypothetical protein
MDSVLLRTDANGSDSSRHGAPMAALRRASAALTLAHREPLDAIISSPTFQNIAVYIRETQLLLHLGQAKASDAAAH